MADDDIIVEPDVAEAEATAAAAVARVTAASTNFGDTLAYLSGPECAGMSSAQKNAFLHISLGVTLEVAKANYHPSNGYDPIDFVNPDTLLGEARIFSTPIPSPGIPPPIDPVVTVQQPATAVQAPRRSSFGFPLASSTHMGAGSLLAPLPPTANPSDASAALILRLGSVETQLRDLNKMNKSSFVPSYEESDFLIPPPILGTKQTAPAAIKSLRILIGTDRFCLDDSSCASLRNLLPLVSQVITTNNLDERSSYLCLMAILKGDINTTIGNLLNDERPFLHAWKHLQLLGQGVYSREQIEREIRKLVNTRPTSISLTFSRLQILYKKLYQHIDEPFTRAAMIRTSIIEDIYKIISSFYPSSCSQIENLVNSQRNDPDFDEVSALIEISTSYVSRRHVSLGPETARMHPIEVHAEAKVLATNVVATPSVPQTAFPSAPIPQPQFNSGNNQGYRPRTQNQNTFHEQRFNQGNNGGRQQSQRYNQQGSQNKFQNQFRANNGGYQNQPRGYQNQGAPRQQGYANQQNRFRPDVAPDHCWKCNIKGHWAVACRKYSAPSGQRKCQFCAGFHSEKCLYMAPTTNSRAITNESQQGARTRNGSNQTGVYVNNKGAIGSGQPLPETALMNPVQVENSN